MEKRKPWTVWSMGSCWVERMITSNALRIKATLIAAHHITEQRSKGRRWQYWFKTSLRQALLCAASPTTSQSGGLRVPADWGKRFDHAML